MKTEPRSIPPVAILCGGCNAAIEVDPYMLDTPLACAHCDTPIVVASYDDLIDAKRAVAAERKEAKRIAKQRADEDLAANLETQKAARIEAETLDYAKRQTKRRSIPAAALTPSIIAASAFVVGGFAMGIVALSRQPSAILAVVLSSTMLLSVLVFVPSAIVALMRIVPLPIRNAIARNHPSRDAIAVMTWLGLVLPVLWIAALIWSLSIPKPPATQSNSPE